MKKAIISVLSIALLVSCLAACGAAPAAKSADLPAFWDKISGEYEMPAMADEVTPEELETFYAGLKDISLKQSVIKVPMMTASANEFLFVECEKSEDVAKVQEIFQKCIDDQAAGGAWYPESVAAWAKAKVATNGNYVAMIAGGDNTEKIVTEFNDLFK
ncbi:MAG: DUF4358 domain-containing protein [Oscillospiraceae bacterium]